MAEWLQPEFDKYRHWIEVERSKDRPWSEVALGKPGVPLDNWLRGLVEMLDFPSLGETPAERLEMWNRIVDGKRKWEEEAARNGKVAVVVGADAADRNVEVPSDPRSSWLMYKKHLLRSDWRKEAVDSIEFSSTRILRRLKWGTDQPEGAVKGMVVGHVQSGKTASMAGLISMAMDWGWNLVIVLTGTIEILRRQTHERLLQDLNHEGNLGLRPINFPGNSSPQGERAQDLHFSADSRERYLIVSLKNSSRLAGLLAWLQKDHGSLEQMRILLIDDEADQAGINTNVRNPTNNGDIEALIEERRQINRRIVRLTRVGAKCVNYVAYTATPYANFLNEAWPESLYPRNFIVALPQSPEHFGPKQIFGIADTDSEGGLGIVCDIPVEDLILSSDKDDPTIARLHSGDTTELPDSLKEAVSWFLCCVAAIRHFADIRKPISMLVHTSMLQIHHARVADAIGEWLRDESQGHFALFEEVWERRSEVLSREIFAQRFPQYARLDELRSYPKFDPLVPHLKKLLASITHIKMEQVGDDVEPVYHSGVHVCVDNCANNGINDEGEHLRLLYPTKSKLDLLGVAPAFLVVGGSTLSRGLTIENLVSTYFLRSGAQMDTLMQMGRWFGFRRGYELLPRIWMPQDTRQKFEYMAGVEQELRDDLALFMDCGRDPSEYGPRIKVHPTATWLRPTAKNRMQESQGSDYDFSGINKQVTVFHSGEIPDEIEVAKNILSGNIDASEVFLSGLAVPSKVARNGRAIVWRGVSFDEIGKYLRSLKFHGRAQFFQEIHAFIEWFTRNSANFEKWNVVVAGTLIDGNTPAEKIWKLAGNSLEIGKITRTRLNKGAGDGTSVGIGTLRDPGDLLADADGAQDLGNNPTNRAITQARREAGLESTPQLLVYRIDKDSKAEATADGNSHRSDLGVPQDLIGISVWMPGETRDRRKTYATHVSVRIPAELRSDADDLDQTASLVP